MVGAKDHGCLFPSSDFFLRPKYSEIYYFAVGYLKKLLFHTSTLLGESALCLLGDDSTLGEVFPQLSLG